MDHQTSSTPLFQRLGILLPALIATALWGSAFPAVKTGYELFQIPAADVYSKLLFAGIRFAGAGIMILLFAIITKQKGLKPEKAQWPGLILLSLTQTGVCYFFYYIGLANTSGVRGSVLTGTISLFSVLFAHFFCKGERLTVQKIVGCIIGFSGIVLMSGSGIGGGFSLIGDGFLLLSSACSGLGFCISRNISQGRNPMQLSGIQLTMGGLLLILVSLVGSPSLHVTPSGILLLVYMMFLSAGAFGIWTALLKIHPVGKVSLYNFMIPIFGTLLSGIVLGESFLSIQFILSLALVCVGIAVVNYTTGKH